MIKDRYIIFSCILYIFASCNGRNDTATVSPEQLNVTFLNTVKLDSIVNTNFYDSSVGQSLGNPQLLGKGQSGEEYYLIKRTAEGFVEVHEQWDDIVIIRSGHGILKTGKEVKGKSEQTNEEPFRNWHGGEIINANERKLQAGDFIIIPAMTAHQYIPDRNDSLTYWTIKVKRKPNNSKK